MIDTVIDEVLRIKQTGGRKKLRFRAETETVHLRTAPNFEGSCLVLWRDYAIVQTSDGTYVHDLDSYVGTGEAIYATYRKSGTPPAQVMA